ncbi:MAG: prepilin-type N-terminal cleavage/methylation domain-containing protein [Verrucomicrobia bacterium]|nr:prepilin-type N-terminal cleavage/methylation domain-containing protein [Verrucomicrobiota bacterium]
MKAEAGSGELRSSPGFTLVELLLVVSLMLLLLGAVAYNFAPLQGTVRLDEGSRQVDSLFQFLKAHSSFSGRRIELRFVEPGLSTNSGPLSLNFGTLQVVWEPEPVIEPGVFIPLREADVYLSSIAENVIVEPVKAASRSGLTPQTPATPQSALPTAPFNVGEDTGSSNDSSAESDRIQSPPVGFDPDGSSDPVEFRLKSVDDQDARTLFLKWDGVSGGFRKRWVYPSDDEAHAIIPTQPEPNTAP